MQVSPALPLSHPWNDRALIGDGDYGYDKSEVYRDGDDKDYTDGVDNVVNLRENHTYYN